CLLEAFAQIAQEVPQARLIFVGSALFDRDDYERSLRERVRTLGLADRVVFVGYRHDLARVLAALDVFAFPSLEKDTTPLALLSAVSAGRPAVASGIDGIREVVTTSQEGVLVPAGQAEPLARALVDVLTDRPLRQRLGVAARQRAVAAFSLDHHVQAMDQA